MLKSGTTLTPMKSVSRYPHTPKLSERKKALFPMEKNQSNDGYSSDSDIGHMSPLKLSPVSNRDCRRVPTLALSPLKPRNRIDVPSDNTSCSPRSLRKVTPRRSPRKSRKFDAENAILTDDLIVPETPTKESPTKSLRTPEDLDKSHDMPKLSRKSLGSPFQRNQLPENQGTPKARVALFLEKPLSAKSFYSSAFSMPLTKHKPSVQPATIPKRRSGGSGRRSEPSLCNRGHVRRSFGQINAGVSHGIKRPKKKKVLTKEEMLKIAENIMNNSPLNVYLAKTNPEGAKLRLEDEDEFTKNQVKQINDFLAELRQERPSLIIPARSSTDVGTKRPADSEEEKENCAKRSKPAESDVNVINAILDDFDASDLEEEEQPVDEKENVVSNLLKVLEDNVDDDDDDSMILSPTSQMCNMASELKLNSPRQAAQNLNGILADEDSTSFTFSESITNQKLFPVFTNAALRQNPKTLTQQKDVQPNTSQKYKILPKPLPDDQYLLDVGQKAFGGTQCPQCLLVYNAGEASEELAHAKYHDAENIFKFQGWKNEHIVSEFPNGRAIVIQHGDPKSWWKKAQDVIDFMNDELGVLNVAIDTQTTKVFLYILNRKIVGCIMAEKRTHAYCLLPAVATDNADAIDMCSERPVPAKCGIQRIWVSRSYRRHGIATRLLNIVRANFHFGHVLTCSEIAFSSPTLEGKRFAEKYTGTASFLVY